MLFAQSPVSLRLVCGQANTPHIPSREPVHFLQLILEQKYQKNLLEAALKNLLPLLDVSNSQLRKHTALTLLPQGDWHAS